MPHIYYILFTSYPLLLLLTILPYKTNPNNTIPKLIPYTILDITIPPCNSPKHYSIELNINSQYVQSPIPYHTTYHITYHITIYIYITI